MGTVRPMGQWAVMIVLSALLVAGLKWASLPAASLLGPMIAGILLGSSGGTLRMPKPAFIGAQSLIGCTVAHAITGSILVSVIQNWPSMVGVTLVTVVASGLVGWLLVRFGSLPGSTAAWGSSPGGAAAMVAMAEEFGADPRLVAFMQYFRVVLVVLTASLVSRVLLGDHPAIVPSLQGAVAEPLGQQAIGTAATLAIAAAGGWAGVRLKVPAGAMLVPMMLGAALHVAGLVELTVPAWLLGIVYATLGWCIGLRFTPEVVRHAIRAVPQMLAATLAIIGLCGVSAWVLTWLLDTDALTAYLATSPGGLDSVAIIAVGSDANVSFVLALQTLRLFIVILTGPPVAKLIARFA